MSKLDRPVNVRDLGGYIGEKGKTVKKSLIYRSAEITNISEDGKKILTNDYGLTTIVDFRSASEIKRAPDSEISGVEYYHIDIMKNKPEEAASFENFAEQINKEFVDSFMEQTNRDFITDSGAIEGYRKFIDLLMCHSEGSLFFHCFAGKDRTGFGAAIILDILGVSKSDIFYDYLLTNEMRVEENNKILEQMKNYNMTKEQFEAMEMALMVNKSYLEAAYNEAEKEYGSLRNYITKALGVGKDERDYLIEKYTN